MLIAPAVVLGPFPIAAAPFRTSIPSASPASGKKYIEGFEYTAGP